MTDFDRPRLLDLFCGAGGAAMGYYRAGFDVVGIDIKPQPHYPFTFIQADALEYCAAHGAEFDAIHASPPCQRYSIMNNIHNTQYNHPDLVAITREELKLTSKPFVIENVYKSPLRAHFMLCGTMFNLRIIRHRYFECDWLPLLLMHPCNHTNIYDPWHGDSRTADKFRLAMGIDWMPIGGGSCNIGTINEAIPPAYTEFIGKQLLRVL